MIVLHYRDTCCPARGFAANASKLTLDRLRGLVPRDPQQLDRLLRYAAIIGRSIARTLSQLERQQRMRLDQPVLPAIKLDL